MKYARLLLLLLLLTALSFAITACSTGSGSYMKFSFDTSSPARSSDEAVLYINSDLEQLILSGDLQMDSGTVTCKITDTVTQAVMYQSEFMQSEKFTITLSELEAGSELLLQVEAVDAEKVSIEFRSDEKLVKNKEKPQRYEIGK